MINMPDQELNFWTWAYLVIAIIWWPGFIIWGIPAFELGAPEKVMEFLLLLSWPMGLWCCIRGGQLAHELDRRKYDGTRKGRV